MSFNSKLPIDSLDQPRFCGIPTFMRLDSTRELEEVDVAVIGIPSDNGAPYRNGHRFGPSAIRNMSSMLRPISPYHNGINVFEILKVIDYGDVSVVPGYFDKTYQAI